MVPGKDPRRMKLLWCYLGVMSTLLFVVMGWDKLSAMREKRRVPEATLFLLAVIGGAPGGIMGMICFRHKIRKPGFAFGFPVLAIAWFAVVWLMGTR